MIPKFFAIGKTSIETTIKTLIGAGHMQIDQGSVVMSIVDRYSDPKYQVVLQDLNAVRDGKQRTEACLFVDDTPKICLALSGWTTLPTTTGEPVAVKVYGSTRVEQLESLCAELYQVLGVYEAPAKVMDKVSAAMNGEHIPDIDLLPFYLEE